MGLLYVTSSGCSVAMALNGHPEPNFDAFEVGSSRKQVEVQLGPPVASVKQAEGKQLDTYRFEMGNSPNGHRAVWNFYLDLATFGIWEVFATIIEARMGDVEETKILYSPDDRLIDIQGYRPPPPSPELQQARDEQRRYQQSSSSQ
jgi:hypothetical protein